MFECIKMCSNKKRHFNYSLQNQNHYHYHNSNIKNRYHTIHTYSAISFLLLLLVHHEFTVSSSEATLLSSLPSSSSESELPKSKLSSLFDLTSFSAVKNIKEQLNNNKNPVNINQNESPSEILSLPPAINKSPPSSTKQEEEANLMSLERRSSSSSGGYTANVGGGGRTHVAISLERVKNPDDQPSNSYKKKKFPITWLRNQYPFNTYYSKKNKNKSNYKTVKYGSAKDPLVGQYSSDNLEFLDPNPSTWIKIPDRPTASIKFHKQTDNVANILQSHSSIPPPSLQFNPSSQLMSDMDLLAHNPSMIMPQLEPPVYNDMMSPNSNMDRPIMFGPPGAVVSPPRLNGVAAPAGNGLMTSESQNHYQPIQAAQAPEPQTGFGGISLSFGNGRSISFGGGQGLTIGGRAGAISIGGKGSDNTPAASGYSQTTKGGSSAGTSLAASGYQGASAQGGASSTGSGDSNSNSASSYDSNGYVSKHPTMSVDIPRRGKKILHANLDMAPIKVRLHSSPRVKITTGSRDPLEKPSDDEQTENEEDIFEPPEPFPKQNTTSSAANETSSLSNTTTTSSSMFNGTELTTLSPMQLQQQQQNTGYPQEFNQYGYNQQQQQYPLQQQQVSFDDHNGNQASRTAYHNGNNIHHSSHNDHHHHHHQHNQLQQQRPPNYQPNYHLQQDLQHFQPSPNHHHQQQQQQQQQQDYQAQVPLDEPRFVSQQVQPGLQQQQLPLHSPVVQQQNYQEHPSYQQQQHQQQVVQQLPERVPFNNQAPQLPMQQPIQPPMQPNLPVQMQNMAPPPPQQLDGGPPDVPLNVNEDQRPAVNHWRQYSRQQMNRFVPKQQDLAADNNPRFYNGGNSIVEPRPGVSSQQQGPEGRESRDVVDMAASNNDKTYTKINGFTPIGAGRFQTPQPHFGPSTVYQIAGQPAEIVQGIKSVPLAHNQVQQPVMISAPVRSAPPRAPVQQQLKTAGPTAVPAINQQRQQQQMQPQESSYHSSSSYNAKSSYAGGSRYAHQEAPTRTWTFGNGGISTSYSGGGSSSGYGSSGGTYGSGGGSYSSGSNPSDGFDQKNYQAKVEKFDPDAHDKRERSKVVVFLKPRISIHSANSSTTTKRPKNQQRLVHVINRPIFLNTTNNRTHHMEEEFIDPDLAEPVELGYGYGYGYGHGYGYGYGYGNGNGNGNGYNKYGSGRRNKTSTTTRKPKTTTTTTTTTLAPDDSTTASTSSSSETDGTTTTTSPSTSSPPSSPDDSSPSSTTTTDSSTTTTTSESPSSSSESSTSPDSLSSTTEASDSFSSSSASSTSESPEKADDSGESSSTAASTTEASPQDNTSSLPPDVSILDIEGSNGKDSTPEPVDIDNSSSAGSTPDDSAADLVMASTEPSKVVVPLIPASTTTMAPTKTSARTRAPRPLTTTTSTSYTTTTPEPPVSSTEAVVEIEAQDALPDPSTTTTTITTTSSTTSTTTTENSSASQDDLESDEESQNPSKRSTRTDVQTQSISSKAQQQQQQQQQRKQQPMLLNAELVDKLMSNKTLVSLMSSQLKRVIDTDKMDELEKRRIVRQVFDQMMEEKVDFSMNNVRLAVKTVSSSYRAAAEKQRQRKSDTNQHSGSPISKVSKQSRSPATAAATNGAKSSKLSDFGKRGISTESSSSSRDNIDQSRSVNSNQKQSKSFPVIDTALKLTKRAHQQQTVTASTPNEANGRSQRKVASASNGGAKEVKQKRASVAGDGKSALGKVDASGNPIVVVLLPQDKA